MSETREGEMNIGGQNQDKLRIHEQDEYIAAPEARLQAAEAALRAVHAEGRVCAEYEVCEHDSCRSSYHSWAHADAYFAAHGATDE